MFLHHHLSTRTLRSVKPLSRSMSSLNGKTLTLAIEVGNLHVALTIHHSPTIPPTIEQTLLEDIQSNRLITHPRSRTCRLHLQYLLGQGQEKQFAAPACMHAKCIQKCKVASTPLVLTYTKPSTRMHARNQRFSSYSHQQPTRKPAAVRLHEREREQALLQRRTS